MSEIMNEDLQPQQKSAKRDGLKVCRNCSQACGLRTLKCTKCGSLFKRKEKDWGSISQHASTMKDSYVKDKLFERMDQLATKPGWTGILFLVHDSNPESKHGRVYTHSYGTKGVGQQIEAALKNQLFKTMKTYLFGASPENDRQLVDSPPQPMTTTPATVSPAPANASNPPSVNEGRPSASFEVSESSEEIPIISCKATSPLPSSSGPVAPAPNLETVTLHASSWPVSSQDSCQSLPQPISFPNPLPSKREGISTCSITASTTSLPASTLSSSFQDSTFPSFSTVSSSISNSGPSSSFILSSSSIVSSNADTPSNYSTAAPSAKKSQGRFILANGRKFFVLDAP